MSLPPILQKLRIPVIAAPMFIVSNPKLVIAQCTSGVVGSFPALNARPAEKLDEWLHEITEGLAEWDRDHPERPAAPFAVNQIVHRSNDRLDHDMEVCARWKVPIISRSLGARSEINHAVHSWGGMTLHDVIDDRFARKAVEKEQPGASVALEKALSRYRGDFLDGEPAGDWHLEHRDRLQRLFVDALMELGDRHADEGRNAKAADAYRRLLARDLRQAHRRVHRDGEP